jgi:hypothetical protein
MGFPFAWVGYGLTLFLCLLTFFLVSGKAKLVIALAMTILFLIPWFIPEITDSNLLFYGRVLFAVGCYFYLRKKKFRIP